jgi:glycerol-3-phosphate O-acyltransferase
MPAIIDSRSEIKTQHVDEPVWPRTDGRDVVFLIDAASRFESRLLHAWIDRHRPESAAKIEILTLPSSRRRRGQLDPGLEPILASGEDPVLAPLRIAWLAPERAGRREVRPSDLLTLADPRDPDRLRERYLYWRTPERCRIVVGQAAPASAVRKRWRRAAGADSGNTQSFPIFVARQAALTLERAEREVRGARYKVPHLVRDDILARPAFQGELHHLARELGRTDARVRVEATADLREIAASHTPLAIDIVVRLWRFMYSRGYDERLRYDPAELKGVSALAQQHPVVFLPSHKSNLDHGVLQTILHENGLPPNHTAGGINMNFFPLGPLVRRSGIFFIRRSFKDDEVYKLVLRHYIDYLISKRFPLEWYIEGGRSRSGKLLPPRFGLLAYVVDAYRRGHSEDVYLIPVSICYDQISDVSDYVAEQRGGNKESEGFGWFVRFIRRLGRRYGRINVRFGEPISLAESLDPPDPEASPDPNETNVELQKLAFEVCVRINRATPITPVSLICLALLSRGDRALTRTDMVEALTNLRGYVERRKLPTSEELDLDTPEGVARTMDILVESGLLTIYDEGPDPVYGIAPNQHLGAAYYRNTIIHYFLTGAIAEVSLLRAAEEEVEDRPAAFWEAALSLRDLLKFEFFFAEKEIFQTEIRQELSHHVLDWENRLEEGADAILEVLARISPLHAHRVLRPFLEAYRVVGDVLESHDTKESIDESVFLSECLGLGHQYALQRHIKRQESVSKVLFGTAVKLARNRGLWEPGGPEQSEARGRFAEEIRKAIRRVDAVEALVRARRAGIPPTTSVPRGQEKSTDR